MWTVCCGTINFLQRVKEWLERTSAQKVQYFFEDDMSTVNPLDLEHPETDPTNLVHKHYFASTATHTTSFSHSQH